MNKGTLVKLGLAALMSTALTAAYAQEGTHQGRKSGGDVPPAASSDKGAASSIPEGQGGTAGTHPTGANVGPGRAGQVKSTGE
jgi:hypothetical protein